MFKFLFVMFFFFILLVFLMGFSILRTFKNILFGSGSSGKKGEQRRQTSGYSSNARSNSSAREEYATQASSGIQRRRKHQVKRSAYRRFSFFTLISKTA